MIPYSAILMALAASCLCLLAAIHRQLSRLIDLVQSIAAMERIAAGAVLDEMTKPADARARPWEERN